MNLEKFQQLPAAEIARLTRKLGPKVCVFPINGTRRWFMLEHATAQTGNLDTHYIDTVTRRHIELYRLVFEHGLHTLITPALGLYHTTSRGNAYLKVAAEGLTRLATHQDFLDFYQNCGVRVRFYGDYHKFLRSTPYAYLAGQFDDIMARTQNNDRHRLFFGMFANDAAETIAQLAVEYYTVHQKTPDKRTLVELYYGEYVEPADLFVGFSKFRAFDMPLITTGLEDLYFMVSPSLYLTQQQWREILYDHIYTRREEPDWLAMREQDLAWLKEFYQLNFGNTLGTGATYKQVWYPRPQIKLSPEFVKPRNKRRRE